MADEVLACGHVYVLHETMVHRAPKCGKCADCCTCVSSRQAFKEAQDAFNNALNGLRDLCQKIDSKAQKEREKTYTKADWQALEDDDQK